MAQAGAASGAPAEVARAHHGSVSRAERTQIEEALKAGTLRAVVATSSLELGIDMGAVDLVVQVESPPSVASGLQRTGRAGHHVGDVSRGVIFPKYQGDLVQAAVVAGRMRAGQIEQLRMPRNPLDVLAQQIIAMTAMDDWPVDELECTIRRAAPFAGLTRPVLESVLDMLAGRYPSEEFAGLRPRVVWDRVAGVVRGRPGTQRLAVTSGGTIPDRGLFGVFLAGPEPQGPASAGSRRQSRRVGELDEEMVYESRVGDVFVLGASSWRIEDITADRVLVTPAPGQPGKLPFWHGDAPGRPAELGAAIGAMCRELAGASVASAAAMLRAAGLDELAAGNLLRYLADQREATGCVPDDRTLVVERFRDELGDWRVVLHSPYGARVHAPWALAIAARLRERYGGMDVQALHTDDGIVLRVPDADEPPPSGIALLDPDEISDLVTAEVGSSALFASRFRECAARALLLPRHQPGRRMPLWQQRQRSAQLLEVASRYGSFPIVLETVRECLQDVFDVPALTGLLRDLAARKIRLVEVETPAPSPFSRSLLFRYVGAFMYEGDAPLAERRAQALTLDSALLAELLGQADLRELLDPAVVAETERDLQRLSPARRCRDAEGVADLLAATGPLSAGEVAERCADPGAAPGWLAVLAGERRVIEVRLAGQPRWAAIEDAGRLRDALGVPLPPGVPAAFTEPLPDPLGDLVARYARTHGPFTAGAAAARYGLGTAVVTGTLRRLAAAGRVAEGEFTPGGHGTQWCDAEVLRLIRRRCLARLRKEAEPVPPVALARLLPAWQGVTGTPGSETPGSGPQGSGPGGSVAAPPARARRAARPADPGAVLEVIEQLAGAPLPASALETLVLPGRVPGYSPALLDELTVAGEVVWSGAGAVGGGDGWVVLAPADVAPLLLPEPAEITMTPLHDAVLGALGDGGGLFFRLLHDRVAASLAAGGTATRPPGDAEVASAIWDLLWAGRLTNDTLAPLRTVLGGRQHRRQAPASARGRPLARYGSRRPAFGRPALPSRTGPPAVSGRWSLVPADWGTPAGPGADGAGAGRAGAGRAEPGRADPTLRAHAFAQVLLDRHGVLTRGAVAAERVPGGFGAVYPVLRAMEDAGRCRRGYFVEGLGGAQFALPGAVDRMRSMAEPVTSGTKNPDIREVAGTFSTPEVPGASAAPGHHRAPSLPGSPVARGDQEARGGPPQRIPGLTAAGEAVPGASPAPGSPGTSASPGSPGTSASPGTGGDWGDWRHLSLWQGDAGQHGGRDRRDGSAGQALVLAAADPANPYGAALPWPPRPDETPGAHRPGRKAGALVVLADGDLVLYVERGGRTLLSWTDDPGRLGPAAAALAAAVRCGALGRLTVERADGGTVYDSPLARALEGAGFRPTPRGLRLRG
jgi:ATP-dependent Lhr-like helicase